MKDGQAERENEIKKRRQREWLKETERINERKRNLEWMKGRKKNRKTVTVGTEEKDKRK